MLGVAAFLVRSGVAVAAQRHALVQRTLLPSVASAYMASGSSLSESAVKERVVNVVKTFQKVDANKVTDTSSFEKDLGLDSLDTVEVVMAIEEEFAIEIPDDDADRILSVADAIAYIKTQPNAK